MSAPLAFYPAFSARLFSERRAVQPFAMQPFAMQPFVMQPFPCSRFPCSPSNCPRRVLVASEKCAACSDDARRGQRCWFPSSVDRAATHRASVTCALLVAAPESQTSPSRGVTWRYPAHDSSGSFCCVPIISLREMHFVA